METQDVPVAQDAGRRGASGADALSARAFGQKVPRQIPSSTSRLPRPTPASLTDAARAQPRSARRDVDDAARVAKSDARIADMVTRVRADECGDAKKQMTKSLKPHNDLRGGMHAAAQVTPRVVESRTRHICHRKRVGDVRVRRRCAVASSPGDAPRDADADSSVSLLEFYSGSGMMRRALANAVSGSTPRRVVRGIGAIDNSQVANAVYEANFPEDQPVRRNVEHLTTDFLEKLGDADVWTASPPCQPYTRKGLEKHGEDARALSFINLLQLFPELAPGKKPHRILVENVVGFETSATRDLLVNTLLPGYDVREFVGVSPSDIGVPNTRPRYYLLAKRKGLGFVDTTKPFQSGENVNGTPDNSTNAGLNRGTNKEKENAKPLGAYLDPKLTKNELDALTVPFSVTGKYWRWLDVVTPGSTTCQCFTGGYGKTPVRRVRVGRGPARVRGWRELFRTTRRRFTISSDRRAASRRASILRAKRNSCSARAERRLDSSRNPNPKTALFHTGEQHQRTGGGDADAVAHGRRGDSLKTRYLFAWPEGK